MNKKVIFQRENVKSDIFTPEKFNSVLTGGFNLLNM